MRHAKLLRRQTESIGAATTMANPPATIKHRLPLVADENSLARRIVELSASLGFSAIGFCDVEPFNDGGERLRAWLAKNYHGEMGYLAERPRHEPRALLPEARGMIVVALAYPGRSPRGDGQNAPGAVGTDVERGTRSETRTSARPVIAGYARGLDYHIVMRGKLHQFAEGLGRILGRPVATRACVDSAPLLERDAAVRAGLGFIGKNTLAIVPGLGSYFLLGELLVDFELPSGPVANAGCGSCRACLDACPTDAFLDAHTLDARRCVSYLTIEHTGPIPRELRAKLGLMVFGCDVCQAVCPFNASPKPKAEAPELQPLPRLDAVSIAGLLGQSARQHRRLTRGTALRRVSRARLARNAAVALGNLGDPSALPALVEALATDPNPLVRSHVAWALGRLGGSDAIRALRAACADDSPEVRREAILCLAELEN